MKENFSGFLRLGKSDFIKGLFMSVLGAAAGVIYTLIEGGNWTIDWHLVWKASLGALITYLTKNLLSPPPSTVVIDPNKTDVVSSETGKKIA